MSFGCALRRWPRLLPLWLFPQVVSSESSTFRLVPRSTDTVVPRRHVLRVYVPASDETRGPIPFLALAHPSSRRTLLHKDWLCVAASLSADSIEESDRNRSASCNFRRHQEMDASPGSMKNLILDSGSSVTRCFLAYIPHCGFEAFSGRSSSPISPHFRWKDRNVFHDPSWFWSPGDGVSFTGS